MEIFKNYAYYYNLFYGNKNYKRETETVNFLIHKFAQKQENQKILNIGCGTGRHDIEFAKLGYQMTGIDFSEDMIAIAEKNKIDNLDLKFEVCDARTYRTNSRFDVVISLFHVMSYQNTNEDILDSFQTAYEALEEGGIFIFDVWYGPGVLTDKPAVRVKELEDNNNQIVRIANPIINVSANIVDVNYQVLITNKDTNVTQEIRESHKMRYYFEPEIRKYLELSSMELITCVDCNNLQKPTFDSWTTYFVARKVQK